MATEKIEVLVCDLCGNKPASTHTIDGLDVDLCTLHEQPLEAMRQAGRPATHRRRTTGMTLRAGMPDPQPRGLDLREPLPDPPPPQGPFRQERIGSPQRRPKKT